MTTFIWPDTSLARFIQAENPDWRFLNAEKEWKTADYKDNTLIIILAEFFDEELHPSEFWGFRILRHLRVELKITAPIAICSLFPLEWFQKDTSRPEHEIFKTPGHYFFQLPIDWTAFNENDFEGIDQNTLYDINDHFFDLEGVLDEEFHAFKNQIIQDQEQFTDVVELETEIKKQLKQSFLKIKNTLALTDPEPLNKIQKDLWKVLKKTLDQKGNIKGGLTTVSHFIGQVKLHLPLPPTKKVNDPLLTNMKLQEIPWKVLFVDDDAGTRKRVKELFKQKGIECKTAKSAEEVYTTLIADEAENLITVLICDYRLQEQNGDWQKIQGYNILQEVFLNFSNPIALFSLTSFTKRTLLRIQQLHQMQVWSYAKEDVIDSEDLNNKGFNVFVAKVIEEGNNVYDWKRSQPSATSWTKGYDKKFDRPLRDYYRLHQLAKDFRTANGYIESKATEIFQAIREAKHKQSATDFLEIPSMQENIGKDKKPPQTEEEKLERFRDKLLGRRVAIALKYYLDMDKGQIFNTMKRNHLTLKQPSESDNSINQYFTTYMALSLDKDIPKRLLPEEWRWLQLLEKTSKP